MELPIEVAALVLLAALLHASWNVLVKVGGDRLLVTTTIIGTGSLACALLIPFVPLPAPASWPYVAASVAIHNVYFFFLLRSYALGDLSQVYPIARGTSPLVVALLAVPFANEALSFANFLGVTLVTIGIVGLATGHGTIADARAVAYAFATGLLIAAFTLVDGIGVRVAGQAVSFIAWMFALEAVPLATFVLLFRRERIAPFFRANGLRGVGGGVAGGLMAATAYGLVLWAYSRGALAAVAALRETSVVMAAVIGAVSLGEPFGRRRILASAAVVAGVALLNT